MIVSLRGTVESIGLGSAVIECNGVGYEVLAAPTTLGRLTRGEQARVLTTMVVREESQTLYGFTDDASRRMFVLLQSVSGLGPKLALAAQSVFTTEDIARHIAGGDAKALQKIPGVGKRMAERMIVDLKDKVVGFNDGIPADAQPQLSIAVDQAVQEQVLEALVGLGFSEKIALPVLSRVLRDSPELSKSQALRAALSELGTKN